MDRLTVIVGAGASKPLGVPLTGAVTERLVEWEKEERAKRGAHGLPYPAIFEGVLGVLKAQHKVPNFEHLLHALETLTSMSNRQYPVIEKLLSNGFSPLVATLDPEKTASVWASLLCREVWRMFVDASRGVTEHANWGCYKDFWGVLATKFALDVITLNYDTAIEQALPEIDLGFQPISGETAYRFGGRAFRHSNGSRLMHAHGCVCFADRERSADINRFSHEDLLEDLYYYPAPDVAFKAGCSDWHGKTQSGRRRIVGPVITGLQKTDKILFAEPYATYYRLSAECLESCPRVLIIGFGFGDLHYNNLLHRLARWHGEMRRIACITFEEPVSSGGRHAPAWINDGIIHRWAGEEPLWQLSKCIEETPWRASTGLCWLDVSGFLSRSTQASEVVDFLNS